MKKVKKVISNKYFISLFSFLLMFLYLAAFVDLYQGSSDAYETVKVIKTFFSNKKYISYVMYKGFYAFLPGVLCYNLAEFLNISWVLLMKIFHCIGFAYIASVGMPYLISHLFKKEPKVWQRYLFIILFFLLERNIFTFISVDFMSLSLLLLCINSLIKLTNKKEVHVLYYLYIGLLLGLCTCLSGQFLPSALILILYGLYILIKKNNKENIKKIILILFIFLSGIALTKSIDKIYVNRVVEPARQRGEWLPTGEEWLLTGFTSNMQYINYPISVPDNLGETIILNESLDKEAIKKGFILYPDMFSIIKTVLRYPVLFCIRWTQRLFLGLLNDPINHYPGNLILTPLLTIILRGSLLFIALMLLKQRVKKLKDLLSYKTIIITSFVLSALVPSIGHVENRYYFAIRSLIIATVFLSPYLPKIIGGIKNFFKKYNFKNILEYKINYNLIIYGLFIVVVILLYAAIYQSAGANVDITYEFF